MNDFAKSVFTSTCRLFTIYMLAGTLAAIAFTGLSYGLTLTLTLLLASFAFAFLRAFFFTDHIIKTLSYPVRILGFGLAAFILLASCAWLGQWFPMDNPWAWGTFTLIYLAILGACCLGYQIYFRRTSGSFDAALKDYHQRMGR